MTGPPRLLVQLESPNKGRQGDSLYRTVQPCRALGEVPGVQVVSGCWLSPELHALAETADVLVLCDAVDVDLAGLVERRRRAGLHTAYEINDHFLAPQPWSPTAYLAKDPLTRSLSSLLARESTSLQFTCPELSRRFGHLNARARVFPNHLWDVPPLVERRGEAVRIGWGGSYGHLKDLEWVVPALREVLGRAPATHLCIMGAPEFAPLFDWVPRGRFHFTPAGSLDDYLRFVDTLDIGLCPNLPTDFNQCRSDIKWVEYAGHGVLAVCSDVEPYRDVRHGETGLRFGDLAGLVRVLDEALASPSLRAEVTRRAHALVAAQRTERSHAAERLEAWGLAPGDGDAPWPGLASLQGRPGGARAFEGSRYLHLEFGELEECLYAGLSLARDRRDATRAFEVACRLAPGFSLPWLYRGNAEPDAAQAEAHLARACELSPRAPAPAYLRGLRLRQLGRQSEAVAELERCRALAPALGVAQAALAEVALEAGDSAAALKWLEDAFAQNPFRPSPGLQAAALHLSAGRPARTVELVEACLASGGEPQGPEDLLLGRALGALGRHAEALPRLERALASAKEPVPVLRELARTHLALGNHHVAQGLVNEARRLLSLPQAR